ncbi:aminopeptidase N [Mesorhizobium sp. Z1-4]|uniref:aminopeptidase N n=1 Tax=Mesorhizobium sp. Z1-4 TaxID=2448478 RepID=UPI000FD8DC02|nr:aminopeptidase N [Mesorhizobium sp. Z1-4]
MVADTGQVFRLEDYRETDYLIPETQLTFRLSPNRTRVIAELTVERRQGTADDAPLVLDGDGLELAGLEIDGTRVNLDNVEVAPDRLAIKAPPRAKRFKLRIETDVDPAANRALSGLYQSNGVFCTQCEAEGFRRITYFLDRPDLLSVYTVRIEAARDAAPLLLSNGNPVEQGDLGGGRHFAVWHDPHPKPSYLFALVAGDLGLVDDRFTTISGRAVALGIYVEKGKEARAAFAMDALKRSMRWDEERFGREYDLDVFNIVAVSDFNMGAMENKGLNIFNDKYVLADKETATDADYARIEAIIAHEYFHNWTGNRITCRDWFQLCLKEGLTVYRDQEFTADERSRAVERISDVRTLRAHQFPEDQGPLAHPVRPRRYREINNFYTATVYEKGAEIVRMIRTIVGEDGFREGMDLYFDRHDGQAVTIEDFIAAFEDASGADLAQFALWYHQAGTPNVAVNASYDAVAQEFVLELEQSVPPTPSESRKRVMHIPLAFGLVGPDGQDLAAGGETDGAIIHLHKRKQTVRFKGVAERPVLSINRGFSAPVTLAAAQNANDRLFLARHDGDAFARWEALNTLYLETLIAASKAAKGGKPAKFGKDLLVLAGEIAADEELDPDYRALLLSLPSETDIAREIGSNIDPDAILQARRGLAAAIAEHNGERFAELYAGLADTGAYVPDAAGSGRRALRNTLLDYCSAASSSPARAAEQFHVATNMTDRAAALAVLADRFAATPETEAALSAFEARYGSDAIVMDKWFQVQAMIPGVETVERVATLAQHRGFRMDNPNRVRALIGAFASANQTAFNAADGSGYAFVADAILAVEAQNPQVAARLATAFRSWRSLEPKRQAKARETLSRIAAKKGLSRDLADIVQRTLA